MPSSPVEPFVDSIELRQELIDTCLVMRDRLGYFIGTWGNVSVRVEDGFLVTPTRMSYDELTPFDLVVISWDGKRIKGERVPTSEMEMHRQLLLKRPDLGVLIHHHGPWSSVCACAQKSIPVLSDDMAEVVGGEVNCAPYSPAGRHKAVAQGVSDAIGPDAWAVLMANHGVICGGRTFDEAVVCCQFVEKAAMVYTQAQSIGGVKPIPEELWREERSHYIDKYGKASDLDEVLG